MKVDVFHQNFTKTQKNSLPKESCFEDDPYGIRTRVTAVKGRCLNRLTNGPCFYVLIKRIAAEGIEPPTSRV